MARRLRHTRMSTTPRAASAVLVLVTMALLTAGCGGDGESSAGDAGSVARSSTTEESGSGTADSMPGSPRAADRSGDTAAKPGQVRSGQAKSGQSAVTPPMSRAVISTGQISLHDSSVGQARAEVVRLVSSWNGQIADEQTDSDDRGRLLTSTMTLRVPSVRFGEAMTALAGVGKLDHQSRKSEDVTTEVIDVDARIRTQEVSLRRLRDFLGRATDVETMIRLESEIAQREAELSSLRAQQRYLDDQTSLATITVTLDRVVPPKQAEEDDPLDDAGFLTGLRNGWNALLDILVVTATVVGALIPFAVLVAILGLPLAVWLRAARRRTGSGSAAQPPAPSGP